MVDFYEKVQNKLKEKHFKTLKQHGYQNVSFLEIDGSILTNIHEEKGLPFSHAQKMAERDIEVAEGEVFKEDHPIAPKKWRVWAGKKSKEF